MKKQLTITIITGLILVLSYQLTAQTTQPKSSPYLDGIIETHMANAHIPGLSSCIVKEGQIRWIGAYGMANFEQDIPVDTSTLFMLASVSKTVTVTALMQLWEEDLFELDDDINDYLDFEVRIPGFPTAPITFKMLCTHTSSIEDNWGIMYYYWGQDSPIPLGEYLFDYLNPEGANYDPELNFLNQPPGTVYDYSNTGAALIGYLVEIMGDSTFSYQTQENIFEPLGMNETSWFLSELDTLHIAMPYSWNGSGYTPYGHYGYSDYPAGQLRTSIDQLANFLLCYMNGGTVQGQQILQSETVDMILTPQIPQIAPDVCLIWHRVFSGGKVYWGHGGGDNGVKTTIYFRPEDNTGVIFLTNGEVDFLDLGVLLFNYAADSIEVHCLPEGITFTTQEEIDNFQTNYPYCTEIEGDVEINGDEIQNLNGLDMVTAIGGDLRINSNDALTSLSGIENITSIGGELRIVFNTSLTSLSGLENIEAATITDLSIFLNTNLSDCDAQSICDYLATPNGTIEIHDNASGCASQSEVQADCDSITSVVEIQSDKTFTISPNPLESTSLIQYTLNQNSPVTLQILDLSGREMLILVDEYQQQGEQHIIFNTGDLPSGIYFCVLKTNNEKQTKKIIKL